jgi:hypothetical protein
MNVIGSCRRTGSREAQQRMSRRCSASGGPVGKGPTVGAGFGAGVVSKRGALTALGLLGALIGVSLLVALAGVQAASAAARGRSLATSRPQTSVRTAGRGKRPAIERKPGGASADAPAIGRPIPRPSPVGTPSPSGGLGSSDISGGAALEAISCAPGGFCAAVDERGRAYTRSAGQWSSPAELDYNPFLAPQLLSVSCASKSFCVAGGAHGAVWTWNGQSWSGPNGVTPGTVTALSCPSASFCMAADQGGEVASWNGSAWSQPVQVTLPRNLDIEYPITAISCASSTFCAAVGATGYAYTFDGSRWSAGRQVTADDLPLSGISCPLQGVCVAVDATGAAYALRSGSWSSGVQVAPPLTNLSGISCVGETGAASVRCVAVDAAGDAYEGWVQEGDGTWSAGHPLTAGVPLSGVSCTAAGCAAADFTGGVEQLSWSDAGSGAGAGPVEGRPPAANAQFGYSAPISYALSGNVVGVTSGTFGNGEPGIAAALNEPNGNAEVAVLIRDPAGGYSGPVYYPLPTGDASTIVAADLSGDGVDDLAVLVGTNSGSPEVAVLDSEGHGGFAPAVTYPAPGYDAGFGSPPSLSVVSLSPGALPSLLVGEPGLREALEINDGHGALTPGYALAPATSVASLDFMFAPWQSAMGDFSGPGALDLADPDSGRGLQLDHDMHLTSENVYNPSSIFFTNADLLTGSSIIEAALKVPLSGSSEGLVALGYGIQLTRYWVGPQGALAPVQTVQTTGVSPLFQAAAVGYFGSGAQPGVAAIDQSGGLVVFPTDGGRFTSPVTIAPDGNQSSFSVGVTAINQPRRPSDLAVVSTVDNAESELQLYLAGSSGSGGGGTSGEHPPLPY